MRLRCLSAVFGFGLVGVVVVGCGATAKPAVVKKPVAKSTRIATKNLGRPGEIVKRFDLNEDKIPDLWKFYVKRPDPRTPGKTLLQLVRIEIDLNGDGRVDIRRYYDPRGSKIRDEFDLDYDGRFDVRNHYYQRLLTKQEYFMRRKDRPDLWKYFEPVPGKKGRGKVRLVKKERDTNGDGKVDYWEYWEAGKLDRIGRDTDFDGSVDAWERRTGG